MLANEGVCLRPQHGQSSCGGVAYGASAKTGTANAASAVNSFNSRCPNTKLVLVGYSQVSTYISLALISPFKGIKKIFRRSSNEVYF